MTNLSVHRNKILERKIHDCKSSSRIDLRKEKLTDADIEIVIREAIINKQCTMLWLVDNQLSSHSISTLASIFNTNTTLEGLSLCQNNITDADLLHLTKSLSNSNAKLNRLALTSNHITDQGVQYLVEMLETNRSLTQLWLGSNQITDYGVQLLMNVLTTHNETLHILSLSWNQLISDLCVDFILHMLEHNRALRMISLLNCQLSKTSKTQLLEAAKTRLGFYFEL